MKRGPLKPGPPGHHMGFDLDGRPLPLSSEAVRAHVTRVIDDPESELVACVLRYKGDLMLHIEGPPSRETLRDLQQVLRTLVDGYAHILKGQ